MEGHGLGSLEGLSEIIALALGLRSLAMLHELPLLLAVVDVGLGGALAGLDVDVISKVELHRGPADLGDVLDVALPVRTTGAGTDLIANDEITMKVGVEVEGRRATTIAMVTSETVVHARRGLTGRNTPSGGTATTTTRGADGTSSSSTGH